MSPSPGPTLDIAVAAPEIEVIKFKPVNDSNIEMRKNIKKYKNIKEIKDEINLSLIFSPSYVIGKIPLG